MRVYREGDAERMEDGEGTEGATFVRTTVPPKPSAFLRQGSVMKAMRDALLLVLLLASLACGARSGLRDADAESPTSAPSGGSPEGEAGAAADSGAPSQASDAGCNYSDPFRHYAGKGSCANIDWACMAGQTSFQDSCGCGCILPDAGK